MHAKKSLNCVLWTLTLGVSKTGWYSYQKRARRHRASHNRIPYASCQIWNLDQWSQQLVGSRGVGGVRGDEYPVACFLCPAYVHGTGWPTKPNNDKKQNGYGTGWMLASMVLWESQCKLSIYQSRNPEAISFLEWSLWIVAQLVSIHTPKLVLLLKTSARVSRVNSTCK